MAQLSPKEKRLFHKILIAGGLFVLLLPIHQRELVSGWPGLSFFSLPFWAWLELPIFLIAYLIIGGAVLKTAGKNLLNGQVFDENFLMSLATLGAFALGEYAEALAVMLFYQVGELFESYAVSKSRRSIATLMDIRPDYANLLKDGLLSVVDPEELRPGDHIVIRPGERIPLDGRVIEGRSSLDTSALTGESAPRDVAAGDLVISGCINQSGLLTVSVTKEFGESTVVKVLELVENAADKKSKSENFITRFARYYTPAVVFSALALAILPPLMTDLNFALWVERALTFLVISCPCALVISVPLSFFGGIGAASKCGILIKGSNYLEQLAKTEVAVFDKTGTLTKGSFAVEKVFSAGMGERELLFFAAHAESFSSHPIAQSILTAYGKEPEAARVREIEELPGRGVRALVDDHEVLAGNARLLREAGLSFLESTEPGSLVYLAVDGSYAGYILIADQLKADAKRAVSALKAAGVRSTVMLTGDLDAVGQKIAVELGIDRVYTELLPAGKVERLEALLEEKSDKGTLVFMGDGINDAPVLARADIGVAMGGLGADAAIEAADVVIMTDEPSKLAQAITISRKTLSIVRQNIVFALSVKALFLFLGAFGLTNMWGAVFADVGVSVLAILNAMRALRVNFPEDPAPLSKETPSREHIGAAS